MWGLCSKSPSECLKLRIAPSSREKHCYNSIEDRRAELATKLLRVNGDYQLDVLDKVRIHIFGGME